MTKLNTHLISRVEPSPSFKTSFAKHKNNNNRRLRQTCQFWVRILRLASVKPTPVQFCRQQKCPIRIINDALINKMQGRPHALSLSLSLSFSLIHPLLCSCSVWPDVRVKSSPNVSKSYSRISYISFQIRVMFFKIAEKVANKLSYFCEKFCHEELSKIAQTGHTAPVRLHLNLFYCKARILFLTQMSRSRLPTTWTKCKLQM